MSLLNSNDLAFKGGPVVFRVMSSQVEFGQACWPIVSLDGIITCGTKSASFLKPL